MTAFAIAGLGGPGTAIAQGRACSTGSAPNQDPDLAIRDPGVVPGGGTLTRRNDQYIFSTFSVGNWDPMMAGRACLRYEIINDGSWSAQGRGPGPIDDTIYWFRWRDIHLNDLMNIASKEHFRWYTSTVTS